MVGIVVATHGNLAESLVSSTELLSGKQDNIETCGLFYGDDVNAFAAKLKGCVEKADVGDGVLIFVDVFGGTPCNQAMLLLERQDLRCIAGVNMPMLIQAIGEREDSCLQELYDTMDKMDDYGVIKVSDLLENIKK